MWGSGPFWRIMRDLRRTTRVPIRGDRKVPKHEPRGGPKLVRGRGLSRRRPEGITFQRFLDLVVFALLVFVPLAAVWVLWG